jgi:hypothetical protein
LGPSSLRERLAPSDAIVKAFAAGAIAGAAATVLVGLSLFHAYCVDVTGLTVLGAHLFHQTTYVCQP